MNRHVTPNRASEQVRNVLLPSESEPEPDYRPADMLIPNEVIEYVGTPLSAPDGVVRTFTHAHAFLIGHVGMYAHYRGVGCWASNKLLGEKLNVSTRHVRRMIEECLDLGFLIDEGEKPVRIGDAVVSRRVLRTAWSGPVRPVLKRRGPVSAGKGGHTCPTPPDMYVHHTEDQEKSLRENSVAVRETRSGDDVISSKTPSKASRAPVGSTKPPVQAATPPHKGPKPAPEGLFPDQGAEGQTGAVSNESRSAEKLRSAVVKRTGNAAPWRRSQWAAEFTRLTSALSGDVSRIESVLDWYVVHMGGEYVPVAHCAKSFREKFTKIEEAMKRDRASNPVPEPVARTPLHPDADEALALVLRLNWPGEAPQRLPGAISRSLTAAFEFRKALRSLELSKAADEIRQRILKDPTPVPHFIGNWFQLFHKSNEWKDDWDGDLKKAVWRADHPEFAKIVGGWVRKHNSFPMNQEAWAELLSAYKRTQS